MPYGSCEQCGELLNEEEAPEGVCENCAEDDEDDM